jgi:hypothetical protein
MSKSISITENYFLKLMDRFSVSRFKITTSGMTELLSSPTVVNSMQIEVPHRPYNS